MDKKVVVNKKVIAIAIIVAVVLIAVIAAIVVLVNKNKEAEDGVETAITAPGIVKAETYEGLKFDNVMLVKTKKGYFTLTMNVTNTTDKTVDIEQVNIPLKNDEGNTVVTLLGNIGEPLKAGESKTITASTKQDLSNVTTKSIEERK